MFWDNYYNLCLNNGISPNAAAKEMKISSGAVTEWKKGRVPQMAAASQNDSKSSAPLKSSSTSVCETVYDGSMHSVVTLFCVSSSVVQQRVGVAVFTVVWRND